MATLTETRILGRHDLQALLNHCDSPCLSLFAPTHRTGQEQKQDAMRLKNLVVCAEKQLLETGLRRPDVENLLRPFRDLLIDDLFWQHQCRGLALFRGPEFFRRHRLPLHFEEQLVIADRFHVTPLLPLLHCGGRYFVLALSQDSARLLESTRDSLHELELPEIPIAEVDAIRTPVQFHSHRRGIRPASDEAIYHGRGGSEDRTKANVLNYFHRVNDAVTTVLEGEDAPLVLACVGYLAPIYETASSYSNLLRAKVPGHPKVWTDDELCQQAWKLVEPYFSQRQRASLEAIQYQYAAGNGLAVTNVRDAVVAAQRGRVDTLLLVRNVQQWGHVDQQLDAVHMTDREDGSVELLNCAAAETLNHGGSVFSVDAIPGIQSPIAALVRY